MTQAHEYEIRALNALIQAVSEALERKRRLVQYTVVWRDDRSVCIGPDAPVEHRGVTETGSDDLK